MLRRSKSWTAVLPPFAFLALISLAGGAMGALVWFSFGANYANASLIITEPYVWRIVRFTLWQAFLSTLFSVAFAIPVASLLHENDQFIGRSLLLKLFALPLVLPQIVAVLAIVSLYGTQGYFTAGVEYFGVNMPLIYGLQGILIAHVFFNMPLMVRIILGAMGSMPQEYQRLSHQLSLSVLARLRHVYWPYMRPALFNGAALVFMLCVTSFTVVLTLGGGPRATTLEFAIYQALTYEFDVPRAVVLTGLQLTVTLIAVFALARTGGGITAGMTIQSKRPMVVRRSFQMMIFSILIIGIAALFVIAPLIAVAIKGFAADLIKLLGQEAVQKAILTSLGLGVSAALLAVILCLALAEGAVNANRKNKWIYGQSASLILVVPPIVISAGWFILLRPFVNIYDAAPYLVVAVNGAMALPFAMRFILNSRQVAAQRHDRLCAQLNISGMNKWRFVLWPQMKNSILVAFAFAFALSLGDLGVIALFGSEKVQTLPFLIFQRMGSYRTDDAAGLAFILACITMAIMMFVDRNNAKEIRT